MTAVIAPKYTAADITVLEGLEPVRKRPGMYIGGIDSKALHHLCWEIVDNSVDEYLNGYADSLTVILHKSGDAVSVIDNGRGIPIDIHPTKKKPALEIILTTLHSGAKFGEGDSYFHSGGLHGVGSSVVNALSRKLIATIRRDGFEYRQSFSRGVPTSGLETLGTIRGHGTTIYFEPDETIFKITRFDPVLIRSHLEDMAYIHSGLKVKFVNEVNGESFDLSHPGGIQEFLSKLIIDSQKPAITETPFYLARGNGDKMEVALQWTEATEERIRSYVNGIKTPQGGTHENGLKTAVRKAISNYIETHEINTKNLKISTEDIREGLVCILSVFVREPMFQGQTKERLNNPEMDPAVESFVRPALESWLNNNRTAADQIIGRIILAAKARQASRDAANEVKRKSSTNRRLSLPGKLSDCKSGDREETELYIVEGESAGGTAKQGRDNNTQAVLGLKGKILNAEGLSTTKVLQNQEIADLVAAIGTGAGEKFDIAGLRYGKIILLMDADADGCHISTLLLDFFFRHMPDLIRKGHVFIAQPPLYRIDQGKDTYWARDDVHKEEIINKFKANAKFTVKRFKGLGEMEADELSTTTLDPKNRVLLKVEIDSNLEADQVFDQLLGKDAKPRFQFIMDRADQATTDDLDI